MVARSRVEDDLVRDASSSLVGILELADRTYLEERSPSLAGFLRRLAGQLVRRLPRPRRILDLLAGLTAPDERQATRAAYRPGRPEVCPSPIHPDGFAATVLNVPEREVQEFLDVVVSRYRRTLRRHWVKAATLAWAERELAPVGDDELAELFRTTVLSRLLNPILDRADRTAFSRVLRRSGRRRRRRLFKVDLSAVAAIRTFDGVFVAPTCTLLASDGERDRIAPLAIRIGDALLEPADGAAWELAKYFVLQGAGLCTVVGIHPTVHFPMDSVNGLTKSVLPRGHVLRRLLAPHLYMQLPLDYAVLYIDRSVAHNDQREIYTPFPGPKEGIFELIRTFQAGVPGNSSYPGYRYPLRAPDIRSEYGRFISAYHRAILGFVRQVCRAVRPGDPLVERWADAISAHVPGFPDRRTIWVRDTLARALATFICNVSVVHSADHHSYAAIPINKIPLRLRCPPPREPGGRPLDRARLVRWEDLFRQRMAWEMYFKPTTVRRLMDVRYSFTTRRLCKAAARFRRQLVRLDARLPARRIIPLDEIATSIQF
jgi:hypothetical protein